MDTNQHIKDVAYIAAMDADQIASLSASASKAPKYMFSVGEDIAVVGYKEGEEILSKRYFMVACDAKGYMVRYGWETSVANAEFVFQHFAPAVSEWSYWRCEYGSIAYQENNGELEAASLDHEGEFGPAWMNYPLLSSGR